MAKNKMYLCFNAGNETFTVYLGKRGGWGWYDVPANIHARLSRLFDLAEQNTKDTENNQDDFFLAMEDPGTNKLVINESSINKKLPIQSGRSLPKFDHITDDNPEDYDDIY